ncbi:MAG: excinuclease ABC subunit UvrA [Myxococcota bacterium]
MTPSWIQIRGAEVHNLQSVDVDLPRGALTVLTGPSGSGKSSLAFDTLYAEGRRRYVESLSTYARQLVGGLERPRVRQIRGLSPTLALQQGQSTASPRSTVGTLTELADFLRLLYARVGVQHCHRCQTVVKRQSAQEMVHVLSQLELGTRFSLLAPLLTPSAGSLRPLLLEARKKGYARVRLDGTLYGLDEVPEVDARVSHTLELVIDRLVVKEGMQQRLTDSVETALREGQGVLKVLVAEQLLTFTEKLACTQCGTVVPEKTPQLFSFNSPQGMCPTCTGLGTCLEPDVQRVVPDPGLSIGQGAILPWASAFERQEGATYEVLSSALTSLGIEVDQPFRTLSAVQQQQVLYGTEQVLVEVDWSDESGTTRQKSRFEGAIPALRRRLLETRSEEARRSLMEYVSQAPCPACEGMRLRPEALAVRLGGLSLGALQRLSLSDALMQVEQLELMGEALQIAAEALAEVRARLRFLVQVGLPYLSLERGGPTLSGGELTRIRLASQLGSELTGVTYVLDEPSVGLHPRDNGRLLEILRRLRDLGNTVVVVEHELETVQAAEYVVDFGPGAGANGGRVLYAGGLAGLLAQEGNRTGGYLQGRLKVERGRAPSKPAAKHLVLEEVRAHNLHGLTVRIPLERLVAVTGVSGAGKSTLVHGVLYPALLGRLHTGRVEAGSFRRLAGLEHIDQVILVEQGGMGRSARSIPATYVRLFDPLRKLFAQLPEAKIRGFTEQRFSFNLKGGRCEACQGEGIRRVEMAFLSDVEVRCEVCNGRRYNEATLEVKYKGLSMADMLEQPVETLYPVMRHHPQISRILFTLLEVGLGYLSLGQRSTTLSGGEAQRLKLARELARQDTGRTLYLLDEPTTGLHFDDVARLLSVLERLVEQGNSVLMIEHDMHLVSCCDQVLELGPEGGVGGGRLVAEGTPEWMRAQARTPTGEALRHLHALSP